MLSKEQEKYLSYFKNAVKNNEVCNSYIISGPEGVGKKYLADILSLVFSCEKNEGCSLCPSCKSTLKGANSDILRLRPQENKNYELAAIREVIKKAYEKSVGKYKLIIFEDAHRLTAQCQNALLKTVEEGPSYAVFIFLTPNILSLLQTLRSRSSQISMHAWKRDEFINAFPLDKEKEVFYELSSFNPKVLKNLLSDEKYFALRDETILGLIHLVKGERASVFKDIKIWEQEKERIKERLEILSLVIRDVLLYKDNIKELITNKDKTKEIEYLSQNLTKNSCAGMEKVILSYFGKCTHRENPLMTAESLFVRLEEEIND